MTEEYIEKLEMRMNSLDEANLILPVAAAVHARQVERIFGRGEKANGRIGNYSTKPEYEVKTVFKNAGGFVGVGKTGKTIFKSGKPHQSMFLQQGYKQLKQLQGMESSFVNLTYSADLKKDFAASLSTSNGAVVSGVSTSENAGKMQNLKAKYGDDLFALTDDERTYFKTEVTRLLNEHFF